MLISNSGCDPLTPEDVAEVIVFAAGRRENVVVADTLLYPSHQVSNLTKDQSGLADDLQGILDTCASATVEIHRRPIFLT
jgi:hypothetical protein